MTKQILHMLTPLPHVSPFDANMALDAGYDAVLPYTGVKPTEVAGLVQDAIFSRPPKSALRTGVFIGGRDATMALDMLDSARKALVPPFLISLFADPAGSFTTAAAMVAHVQRALRRQESGLSGCQVAVFGATGIVGFASAVIAAGQGAEVTIVGYDGPARVARAAEEIRGRFDLRVTAADGGTEERKAAILRDSEVIFSAGRAGLRIVSAGLLAQAPKLRVAADVNAVPPTGIEGVEGTADATPIPGTQAVGIGALTIGRTKYQVQFDLFRRMIDATEPQVLDFREAFELAQTLVPDEK